MHFFIGPTCGPNFLLIWFISYLLCCGIYLFRDHAHDYMQGCTCDSGRACGSVWILSAALSTRRMSALGCGFGAGTFVLLLNTTSCFVP